MNRKVFSFRPTLGWSRVGLASALGLLLALSACGGDDSSPRGSKAAPGSPAAGRIPSFAKDFTPPKTGCGSFDAPMPADADRVLAGLDAEHQRAYGGYFAFPGAHGKIVESPWANWKPKHRPPYKVALVWGPLTTDWQVQLTDNLKKFFKRSPAISDVSLATTGTAYDVGQQLQLYSSAVRRAPDLIVLQPLTPESFSGPIEAAAKRGIPTVTVVTYATTPSQVAVDTNPYLGPAMTASYTAKVLGGKGNVVYVEGIAGSAVDAPAEAAWNRVISRCPGMKASKDKLYAAFAQATAKQEMLKYLGTHPEKVDGVFETQVMDTGVMQAFDQSGRPMPIVPSNGLTKGALGYWRQHQSDGYYNSGQTILPVGAARAASEVALRMLGGQGLKLNSLVAEPFYVTDAGLADLADPTWNLSTPGGVGGSEQSFMPSKYIDDFFNDPKPVE